MQKNLNKTISQLLHHEWVGPTPTHDDSFIQQNLYRLYILKLLILTLKM